MLAKSRIGFKGVKTIHVVCPNCIQKDIATCNSPEEVEQLENAFNAMRTHYKELESSVSGNAGMIQGTRQEIEKMQSKLESNGSTQGINAAGFGHFLAVVMPRIDEVIQDQVSSSQDQDQHQQEYVGTVETLEQLQQDFDSLTERMVDGKGKSQKAHETTKRSIEILLEQIAYVRDQVDHQNVKWGTHDLQDVQYELTGCPV